MFGGEGGRLFGGGSIINATRPYNSRNTSSESLFDVPSVQADRLQIPLEPETSAEPQAPRASKRPFEHNRILVSIPDKAEALRQLAMRGKHASRIMTHTHTNAHTHTHTQREAEILEAQCIVKLLNLQAPSQDGESDFAV